MKKFWEREKGVYWPNNFIFPSTFKGCHFPYIEWAAEFTAEWEFDFYLCPLIIQFKQY
jgi:hypothetical protein